MGVPGRLPRGDFRGDFRGDYDPPYGTERRYNGLRLAHTLIKQDKGNQVDVFLMADAVAGAKRGQKTPEGFYNVERMLRRVLAGNRGRILLCGTCMDARGITDRRRCHGRIPTQYHG